MQEEEDYGFKSLQKFLDRKKNPPKIGRPKKRGTKKGTRTKASYANAGRKMENRYAIIDPSNYEVQRFFDNIVQLQNYFNMGSLYSRTREYEKYQVNVRSTPLIKGYIVVRWTDKEVFSMDREAFINFLHDRVRGWMVINQMERIRENMSSIDNDTVKRLFNYLSKVEDVNSHRLLKDEMD